ncbi:MAG: TlpA family protein disulfide reductase [Clostridium sp.]|nr:TlpA family protein disulfide reductase [Clostridium sp.]MCM1459015.1 TlpA family protein disulfide reductase [Bacteroides sp.]
MKNCIAGCLIALFTVFALTGCGNGAKTDGNKEDSIDVPQEEQSTYQEVLEGDAAPDFTAEMTNGTTFVLSEQKGKVILLNFWATWCGPCVKEMPAFEKLNSEYGQEVVILAINCMEDKDTVNKFISDNEYTFPFAYDTEGEIERKYPSDGIPYTLVIGRDGFVKNIYLGAFDADKQYEEYKAAIEAALGESGE